MMFFGKRKEAEAEAEKKAKLKSEAREKQIALMHHTLDAIDGIRTNNLDHSKSLNLSVAFHLLRSECETTNNKELLQKATNLVWHCLINKEDN